MNVTEKGSIEICAGLCFSLFIFSNFVYMRMYHLMYLNLCLMITGDNCSVEKELESSKATNGIRHVIFLGVFEKYF